MDFAKVESGIGSAAPNVNCVHKCVAWCKKIWYFGTTPVTNPSRGCTNNECFMGGHVICYQIPGFTYHPFTTVGVDYNYAQDLVFAMADHLYMFIYSKFDGFYFYGIHQLCDEETNTWKVTNVLRNGDESMSRETDCSVVNCTSTDTNTIYILLHGEKNDHLKILTLKKNPTWEGYVDMNTIACIDNATGTTSSCLLHVCEFTGKLYALYGKLEGCHVTWDPCKVLTICPTGQTVAATSCTGDNGIFPPFTAGPRCAVNFNNKWIMIGGNDANGQFCRDIWILDLGTFQWSRSSQSVPSDLTGPELCGTQLDGVLFLADTKNGIYNFPVSDL